MNNLRFRAWLSGKHDNMTCEPPRMEYDVIIKDGAYAAVENGDIQGVYPTVPVMQSTGLSDKNGKEIFCGDVVKIFNEIKHERIKIQNGNYKVSFFSGGFYLSFVDGIGAYFIDKTQPKNMEIIGDIYSNPDLLPPSK